MQTYLSENANIVHSPTFESALAKLSSPSPQEPLTAEEQVAARRLERSEQVAILDDDSMRVESSHSPFISAAFKARDKERTGYVTLSASFLSVYIYFSVPVSLSLFRCYSLF